MEMDSQTRQDQEHAHESCECGECNCNQEQQEETVLKSVADAYLEMAKRAQAEFENYRRRTQEELQRKKEDGKIEAIAKLLPCLDLMQKAREMMSSNPDVLMGFDMIIKQFNSNLKEMGIEKIDVVGKQFDPNTANAVAMLCNPEAEDGVVLEEVLPGYALNDKIVRYANVVVNKK